MMRSQRALTLVELLVAMAVLALLVTLAAPSVRGLIELQRLRGVTSQLVTDLQFARNESAVRRLPIRIAFSFNLATNNSCYVLYTAVGGAMPNSIRCDCTLGQGNACNGLSGATELRTVKLDPAHGVVVVWMDGIDSLAFDPVSGGLLSIPTDQASAPLDRFRVQTRLSGPRRLEVRLSGSGRPSVCTPTTGSAVGGTPCAT